MRWPRQRKRDSSQHERADQALQLTERQRVEGQQRIAEDQRLAARFRELRQHNHFAEGFARALREGR